MSLNSDKERQRKVCIMPRPVPGPEDGINIYDLAFMGDAPVRARVEKTLALYPELRRIYAPEFLSRLIPDRRNMDNHLLLLLTDVEDPFPRQFWVEVQADLLILQDSLAFDVFKPKLSQTGRIAIQTAKTELELAAWIRRKGYRITLEPLNPHTGRRCEFTAESAPPTTWEVKSILDQRLHRQREKISAEVSKHLRYIDEPFVLHVDARGLTLRDAHTAAASARRWILRFHRSGGHTFPVSREFSGLTVTIIGPSNRDYGFTGMQPIGPYWLGNEDIHRVFDRIRDATGQVPQGSAGVAVIDTSLADFVAEDEVEDACFGEPSHVVVAGRPVHVRGREAIFRPGQNTRISCVIHYERRNLGDQVQVSKTVYHNPFGENQLPDDLLRDENVRQVRLVEGRLGRYRLRDVR